MLNQDITAFKAFAMIIRTLTDVSDEQLNYIEHFFKSERFKKNTAILKPGKICRKFYFIHRGCIRNYYLNTKGQEKTRIIFTDNSPCTALLSFITGQPSLEFMETLEETQVITIARSDFFRLVEEIPAWETFYRKVLEKTYIFQNQKIEQLLTLSAKDRFLKLISEHPHYYQRLSNRVLSTYLDISPETLSRLKSSS